MQIVPKPLRPGARETVDTTRATTAPFRLASTRRARLRSLGHLPRWVLGVTARLAPRSLEVDGVQPDDVAAQCPEQHLEDRADREVQRALQVAHGRRRRGPRCGSVRHGNPAWRGNPHDRRSARRRGPQGQRAGQHAQGVAAPRGQGRGPDRSVALAELHVCAAPKASQFSDRYGTVRDMLRTKRWPLDTRFCLSRNEGQYGCAVPRRCRETASPEWISHHRRPGTRRDR